MGMPLLKYLFLLLISSSAMAENIVANAHDNNFLKDAISEMEKAAWATMPMSIINTTDNTFFTNGEWKSTMGALTTKRGGLACDKAVNDMRFHEGDYRHWYLAPSDSTTLIGMKKCSKNSRAEPSCIENLALCGRKVRVKCLDSEYCGRNGELSLIAQINDNNPPTNNYLPKVLVEDLTQALGKYPRIAKSVVLYITDFCPADHSNNIRSKQCQRPQVDISTSAFLVMGKTNPQGYINTNLDASVELLDAEDPTPVGPEY